MTNVQYPLSRWSFNQEVSEVFDNHVRQSVPLYDYMQHIVTQMSDFFVQNNTVIYDIGCATGETIYQIHQRHKEKNTTFIGIDESESMLQKAMKKNENSERIHFIQQSIENYAFEYKSNLILSILTIQFIPIEKRERLIRNIYNALNKGGAFLFIEKSYPEHSKIQDMFTQIYHDDKESHGLSAIDIRNKDKSLRGVLNPLTNSENIHLLRDCGFTTVEIFFKYLHFTGYIAIK